ncbi:ABC transporter substrate-binding protein [Breznakiellaceae bacterium SP9]
MLQTIKNSLFFALVLGFITINLPALGTKDQAPSSAAPKKQLEGGSLRFGLSTEPATLDPLSSSSTADSRSIFFNVYEGLVKPAVDGSLVPAVAEDYSIEENGLVYIFTLRKGIKFHDGTPVKPEDVIFTLNAAVKAGFAGFTQIDSIELLPASRIAIKLKAAEPEFLPYLTIGIVPANNPDREKNPIGTGPFAIANYAVQQSLTLKKNPYYWQQGIPHLDQVTYVFVSDSDALLLALHSNSIDAANLLGQLSTQIDKNRFDIIPYASNAVQLLALNNAVKPLDTITVRQAINYAIDIRGLIDAAFYGEGTPSGSPIIPGLTRYYEKTLEDPYPFNLTLAKSLLTQAGYPNGFPLEITVPSNYSQHVDTAQVLVNQLQKAGIKVTIKMVDWATWLSDTYRGRHYEATIVSLDGQTVSPRAFLARYRSDADRNFINFKNPEYDKVYDAILVELDETKRINLYKEAQRIISRNSASVYIQDILGFRAFPKGRFAGFVQYPLYVFDFSTLYRLE